jgi:ribosomal protein S18 acetylase RimI-like enzyme
MITIRPARLKDARSIAQIYVESWCNTYAGMLPDKYLLRSDWEEREFRAWRHAFIRQGRGDVVFAAEDTAAGVVGFVSAGPTRSPALPFRGEIYTLYLRPDFHGQGIGKKLFISASRRLMTTAGPSIVVWVLKPNPARFFYGALGGRFVARRPTTFAGQAIEELAYAWEDVGAVVALDRSEEAG